MEDNPANNKDKSSAQKAEIIDLVELEVASPPNERDRVER